MESQEILKTEIGEIEKEALKPEKVKIVGVRIENIDKVNAKKVVCSVKHPDSNDNIEISSVKYLKNDKVNQSGLWVKFDKDDKIQKGSALAKFVTYLGCITIQSLVGKDVDTTADDKGYLCFKAY